MTVAEYYNTHTKMAELASMVVRAHPTPLVRRQVVHYMDLDASGCWLRIFDRDPEMCNLIRQQRAYLSARLMIRSYQEGDTPRNGVLSMARMLGYREEWRQAFREAGEEDWPELDSLPEGLPDR